MHAAGELAERFDRWLEQHTDGYAVNLRLRVIAKGRFVSEEELTQQPALETVSPYQVDDEHRKA